jgi:hypothetical protein
MIENPYETNTTTTAADTLKLNGIGNGLRSLGYVSLMPAMLLAALVLCATLSYWSEGKFSLPMRVRWPLAMSLSLVAFLSTSLRMRYNPARMAMYLSGGATLFSAIVYDTFIVTELCATTGNCGNPVMLGLLFRFACFSTYVGIPLISIAGLVCLRNQSST